MPVHFITQKISYETGGQYTFGDVDDSKKQGLSNGKYSEVGGHFCDHNHQ